MQVIWVVFILIVVGSISTAQIAFEVDSSYPVDLEYSLDSERDTENINEEEDYYDLEKDNPAFLNSTNEKGNDKESDPLDIPTDVPSLPHNETIEDELEAGKTETELNSPIDKRRNQPERVDETCGDPPSIEHGKVVGRKESSYGIDAIVTYSCEFGYATDGSGRTAQCLMSEGSNSPQWTNPGILCIPRSCGDPGFVTNANRIGSLFTFPNSVSYVCNEGYKLRGNRIRYCQTSGTWSGTLPTCLKISCDPPEDIENGRVSYPSLEFGSELRYQCNSGFILRRYQPRICSVNRKWSGDDPVCQEAQCDTPEAPEHGSVQIVGNKPSVDSRAIFTCAADKILVGSKTSICLETGEWTFPSPKCADPCAVPEVPHGRIGRYETVYRKRKFKELPVGSKIENGNELYLYCENKYEPLGKPSVEEKITCNKGEWSDIPRCEPASCRSEPPMTPNGKFHSINRTHEGGVVYFCNTSYKKTEYGSIKCNFGSWRGKTPVCSDTRCHLDSISFPGLIKGKKSVFYNGETLTPQCHNNYSIAKPNDSKLTCKSGLWIGHLPPCTAASCESEPPALEHGRFKPYSNLHGSIVTYECEPNFILKESSSSKVQCLFGKWEGTPPSCKDSRCYVQDLVKTQGMQLDDTITSNGDFLQVLCVDGYSSTNSDPFCLDGVWTEPQAPCRENDCAVYKILNGDFTMKTQKKYWNILRFKNEIEVKFNKINADGMKPLGSSLYVSCDGHHTFQGKGENHVKVTCSKGRWTPRPVCLITGTPYIEVSVSALKNELTTTTTTKRPVLTTERAVGITEGSVHHNLTDQVENPCTCTYLNADNQLIGYSGTEMLKFGVKVENGSKVKFHCLYLGYYRLKGPSELECKNCETWHSSEYPDCEAPLIGDTVFEFQGENYALPGGSVGIKEGSTLRIVCISNGMANYPNWRIPTTGNPVVFHALSQTTNSLLYSAVLDIVNANSEHNGKYECSLIGGRPNSIEIQVLGSTVTCPKFEEIDGISIYYDKEQDVNSSAIFSCNEREAKLEGSSVLVCLSNGRWSGDPPSCKLQVKCPKLVESEGMSITYSSGFDIDSNAVFHCFVPRIRTGVATTKCQMNGRWADPVPSCLFPNCSLEALFKVVPMNVVPDMELSSDTLPYDFILSLNCEGDLMLHGSPTAKCGKDGQWEVSKIQCVPGCLPLKSSEGTIIVEPEKSLYRIGEFVTLSCPPGESLSSDVVRLMCLNSGWSETEIPNCQLK